MTDKEKIIIDGVNVSECEFYSSNSGNCLEFNGKYTIDICDSAKCSNNPNCYFKQLKRKEQECENLKAEEKYLKQCCAKAGEELAKHSFDYDGKEKNLVVQAMELNEKYEKLEKALEEIEDLMQTVSDADECSYGDFDCCNCDNDNSCPTKVKRLILAIINKAKGEGNE